jgi:hypothetical protein
MLFDAIQEARGEIELDISQSAQCDSARKQLLQIALDNVIHLESHVLKSRRTLNDLCNLRRLLLDHESPRIAALVWESRARAFGG